MRHIVRAPFKRSIESVKTVAPVTDEWRRTSKALVSSSAHQKFAEINHQRWRRDDSTPQALRCSTAIQHTLIRCFDEHSVSAPFGIWRFSVL